MKKTKREFTVYGNEFVGDDYPVTAKDVNDAKKIVEKQLKKIGYNVGNDVVVNDDETLSIIHDDGWNIGGEIVDTKNNTCGKIVEYLSRGRVRIELRNENGELIEKTPYVKWCETL